MAPPGFVLLSADYSQLELRLMAHFSGDGGLCDTLRDPTQDPFRTLAAHWQQMPLQQVRHQCCLCNFSHTIMYKLA